MTVTSLTTNQDLDPTRLREAFGIFPVAWSPLRPRSTTTSSASPRARSPR